MKKNFVILLLSFVVATAIFVGLAMLFGADLFTSFQKVTDGWIFGVLFMCAFDAIKKAFEGAKFTKTYIAMMVLFFANVVMFSFASTTEVHLYSVVGLSVSLVCGAVAIVLPFAVDFIKAHRTGDNSGNKPLDEDQIQTEWVKLRAKVLKMKKDKQKEVLKAKLAFRLVDDSIYNSLDISRAMVSCESCCMTVEAGQKNNADESVIKEAEEYIDNLIG